MKSSIKSSLASKMIENAWIERPKRENDSDRYSSTAFAKMNAFRHRGQLCDVVVKVGGREFPAHRVVLAASSDYFDAMFSSGMTESAQLEIELKSVSADIMEALLDFVYTGHVRVSMDNVQDLLPAASLVQMEGVKAVCSTFLFRQVDASNVLGIRRFAELHSCSDLEIFTKNYAAHNFETVVDNEEFVLLSADELIELLSREDLHIDSEETAYRALIRWVYHDEANRAAHLPNLLNYVRLAIMSVRFLTDVVDNERLIRQSLECRDLVDEAKRFHLRPDLRCQMRKRQFHQRDGGDEYLVVIGGFGSYQSPSDSVEMFNPRTLEWSELPNLPISYRYVAACSLGTCVYVIGGFDGGERLNTVGLLDVAQREDGWRWLAPMHYKRGLSAACTHRGLIYVCGGFDGQTRLRALEVYHPKIDEWRVLEEMSTAREGAGLVVADDTLYCLGGYDGFQLLNSMEAFDLRRGAWTQCKPMYMRRSGAGCAVLVDTLYVCGGYGGAEGRGPLHLDTVEAYNTRMAQWTLVTNMNVPRCYVGACQLTGRVYVAAGYNGNRLLNTVEAFDPIENTWTIYEESRMHNERCDTGMCVVRFLSCAEPPTGLGCSSGPPTTSNQPRNDPSVSTSYRSRIGAPSALNSVDGVQTQVVQVVTPLFQGHTTHQAHSTPPPALVRRSRRTAPMLRQVPESTGAPPSRIPGRRVAPIRVTLHEPTLTSIHLGALPALVGVADSLVDEEEAENDDDDGEAAYSGADEGEEPLDTNLPAEIFNTNLDLLAESAALYVPPSPHESVHALTIVRGGGEAGDLGYPLPDGSAFADGGGGYPSMHPQQPPFRREVEELDAVPPALTSERSPPTQLTQAQPTTPDLGLVLPGDAEAHLQERMAFLRGRESSTSQESSLHEENGNVNVSAESGEQPATQIDLQLQHLGMPPSPSNLPNCSFNSLRWNQRCVGVDTTNPSGGGGVEEPATSAFRASPTSPTVSAIEPEPRSDGEGEEGEGMVLEGGRRRSTSTRELPSEPPDGSLLDSQSVDEYYGDGDV